MIFCDMAEIDSQRLLMWRDDICFSNKDFDMDYEFGCAILIASGGKTQASIASGGKTQPFNVLLRNVTCLQGSAADSQVMSDYVRYFLNQHTIQLGRPATVKTAATLVRELSYQNKSFLEAGLIVGGWDKYEGGSIYAIPVGGTILKLPFATGGSGSSYLYGFLDQAWKEGMTKDEAEALVVKAVSLDEQGVTRNLYAGDKLPRWYEEIFAQNSLLDGNIEVEPMRT